VWEELQLCSVIRPLLVRVPFMPARGPPHKKLKVHHSALPYNRFTLSPGLGGKPLPGGIRLATLYKKVVDFPVPSRDGIYQTLPGGKIDNLSLQCTIGFRRKGKGDYLGLREYP